MQTASARTPRVRLDTSAGTRVRRADVLAVEEPLEVRVDGEAVVVTMRTPGDDVDLALGFLLTEGLLDGIGDVERAVHCTVPGPVGLGARGAAYADEAAGNVLDVTLRPGVGPLDLAGRRTFGMTSACGVCGSASIDAVRDRVDAARAGQGLPAPGEQGHRRAHAPGRAVDDGGAVVPGDPGEAPCEGCDDGAAAEGGGQDDGLRIDAPVLVSLPGRLREAQKVFSRTGGLHAAGLFTADGELLGCAEDVGRHNAVDKVLGRAAAQGRWPLRGCVLQVSGRASFELVAKAVAAGVPVLSAVSAPSSLAVSMARSASMTLAGFVREPTLNLYCGEQRVV